MSSANKRVRDMRHACKMQTNIDQSKDIEMKSREKKGTSIETNFGASIRERQKEREKGNTHTKQKSNSL
jgi:hypothetical protein